MSVMSALLMGLSLYRDETRKYLRQPSRGGASALGPSLFAARSPRPFSSGHGHFLPCPSSTLKWRGSDSILGGTRPHKMKSPTFSPSDKGYTSSQSLQTVQARMTAFTPLLITSTVWHFLL